MNKKTAKDERKPHLQLFFVSHMQKYPVKNTAFDS